MLHKFLHNWNSCLNKSRLTTILSKLNPWTLWTVLIMICQQTTHYATFTWWNHCSEHSVLLFLISCGPPGISPHLNSRKNNWPTLLFLRLIGQEKIQWSCWFSLYRCKNQVGLQFPMSLWRNKSSAHIPSS